MRPQKKVEMPSYSKEGFHSTHPVTRNQKDNKIRGEGDVGDFRHSMSRHGGSPARGYMPESVEANKRPPLDNKISGMPPHEVARNGVAENGRGNGAMRNTQDCYNMSPRYGKEMPMHGRVRAEGTK